jgi:2-alkenal reductase
MRSLTRIVVVAALLAGAYWLGGQRSETPDSSAGAGTPPQAAVSQARTSESGGPLVPQGKLGDWEKSNVELFRTTAPSVAYITTEARRVNPFMGVQVAQGAGSGFVWDNDGHVVTNFHVIEGADLVYVQLDKGDPIPARVVGAAPDYDVAVVQLRDKPKSLRPIPVGSSKDLVVGQATYAIGNPFGLTRTLTTGIVSALERHLPTSGGREVRGVIQTDAAINPGTSGGPLLDSAGRLIGMNTAIYSESGSSAGIGFAIPVDMVKRVVPQIIKTGRAPRPGIGIAAADERVAAQLGVKGVVVLGVARGSPADRAGIKPFTQNSREPGDIIVAVNGKPVDTLSDLAAALDEAGIGSDVTLSLRRGDARRDVRVRVIDLQS